MTRNGVRNFRIIIRTSSKINSFHVSNTIFKWQVYVAVNAILYLTTSIVITIFGLIFDLLHLRQCLERLHRERSKTICYSV